MSGRIRPATRRDDAVGRIRELIATRRRENEADEWTNGGGRGPRPGADLLRLLRPGDDQGRPDGRGERLDPGGAQEPEVPHLRRLREGVRGDLPPAPAAPCPGYTDPDPARA